MIDIQIGGIDKLAKEIDFLRKRTEFRIRLAVEALLTEGFYIASAGFANALYAGTNDVKVLEPYWEGDTLVLEAHGDAVAFIEFGTGINYYDYPDPTVYEKLDMSPHGTYGEGYGSQIRWWYKGEPGNNGRPKRRRDGTYDEVWSTSWGNPPARAMYDASKVLDKERVEEVLRRALE